MSSRRRIEDNPFYVLGLPPTATRMEVEREGHKILSMMELSLSGAHVYHTPFGERPRTPELVREAMATLRDPQKRLCAELWARLGPGAKTGEPTDEAKSETTTWDRALAAMGWGPK